MYECVYVRAYVRIYVCVCIHVRTYLCVRMYALIFICFMYVSLLFCSGFLYDLVASVISLKFIRGSVLNFTLSMMGICQDDYV
jgi:hypothetical protein